MMSNNKDKINSIPKPAAIADIAKLAAVGTATVDRVLNNRSRVRESTRQRVMQAKIAIEQGNKPKLNKRPWRLKVILPGEAGPSTDYLSTCLQEIGSQGDASIECVFVKKMDPGLLARKLVACSGQGIDAVAFQALDHPRVMNAVEQLAGLNIPALTILSGLRSPFTMGSVTFDNRAAGRTAGYLMGRLTRQQGAVAIVTGGELYQAHGDREIGFRAAIRHGFQHIENIITLNGHDDQMNNYNVVKDALTEHSDLLGIYNVGGGTTGIAKALTDLDVGQEIIFLGHHLTRNSQTYLMEGTMDMVLHMNMRTVAQQTVETLIAHLEERPIEKQDLHIEVVTCENMVGIRPNC
jgi:LacI family transcriptional regulator